MTLDKPSRNEEEYFALREAEILKARREAAERAAADAERRSHLMKCPKCGAGLVAAEYETIQVERCPECLGLWFDAGEAETLLKHEGRGLVPILKSIIRGVGSR